MRLYVYLFSKNTDVHKIPPERMGEKICMTILLSQQNKSTCLNCALCCRH